MTDEQIALLVAFLKAEFGGKAVPYDLSFKSSEALDALLAALAKPGAPDAEGA